jgi:hypothetical protein
MQSLPTCLILTSSLAHAQMTQLAMEYDPHPPYHSGSLLQAAPDTVTQAQRVLRASARKELGTLMKEKSSLRFILPRHDP